MWEHKPGKYNQVADALSCKQVQEYVVALTRVESDFVEMIKESSKLNATYQKMVQDVTAGLVRRYWLKDGFCMQRVVSCLFIVGRSIESC